MSININGASLSGNGSGNFTVANSASTNYFTTDSTGKPTLTGLYPTSRSFGNGWQYSTSEIKGFGTTYKMYKTNLAGGGSPGYNQTMFAITPNHGWSSYYCTFTLYNNYYQGAGQAKYMISSTAGDYKCQLFTLQSPSGGVGLNTPTITDNTPVSGTSAYDDASRVNCSIQLSMSSWAGGGIEVEWFNFSPVTSITGPYQIVFY